LTLEAKAKQESTFNTPAKKKLKFDNFFNKQSANIKNNILSSPKYNANSEVQNER
jgi:hypothetical protein